MGEREGREGSPGGGSRPLFLFLSFGRASTGERFDATARTRMTHLREMGAARMVALRAMVACMVLKGNGEGSRGRVEGANVLPSFFFFFFRSFCF